MPNREPDFFGCRLAAAPLILAFALLPAGCGWKTYETRLEETRQYFEYADRLNTNLADERTQSSWNQVSLRKRVPQQFQPIPPPVAERDKEGNAKPVEFDNRQPDYMRVTLPGLLGAWKAEVAVDGREEPAPAYLYVLGNLEYWTDNRSQTATEFHADVLEALTSGLRIDDPADSDWVEERLPRGHRFTESRAFQKLELQPEAELLGVPTEIQLYLSQNADNQVAVLYVLPREADRREALPERITLALETLHVPAAKPRAGQSRPTSGF